MAIMKPFGSEYVHMISIFQIGSIVAQSMNETVYLVPRPQCAARILLHCIQVYAGIVILVTVQNTPNNIKV